VFLQHMVHSLHTFLHLSIFLFLLGLIAVTSSGGALIIVAVNLYIAIPLILYLKYSLMPYFHPHSLYSTPLSGFLFSLRAVPRLGLSLFRAITRRDDFGDTLWNSGSSFEGSWLTLDYAVLEVEKFTETHSSTLDVAAISWLLTSLGQDQELEQFLAGIPGFYTSKRVEDPAQVLRVLNANLLPRAIVSFMDRSLSSELFSDNTVHKRIRVSLKAMETDPYLLQRTFYHALCSGQAVIFKCIDFVRVADRYTDDVDPDLCCLAKCIVAIAISRLNDHGSDERWDGIVQRGLKWSQSQLTEHSGQRDSVKLRNLIQTARELSAAHPDYDDPSARAIFNNTLGAVRQLNIENASHQLRREFCEFWNQLVGLMQDLRRAPVVRSNAMRILSLTRSIYVPLHAGTESRCFAFADSTDDLNFAPQKAATYPLCTVPTHCRSPPPVPEDVIATHSDWET